jgi:hypothetical protein
VGIFQTQFKNNYFTEMCSGSEVGSYLRLIDFSIPTLGSISRLESNKEEEDNLDWDAYIAVTKVAIRFLEV